MPWLHKHVIAALVIYYVFSAIVSGLPKPLPNERLYQFIFVTLHTLAGSLGRAMASFYPNNSSVFQQTTTTTIAVPEETKPSN